MKTPRFIKEYANWRIRKIQMESDSMGEKNVRIERIVKAVKYSNRGLITVDDAMGIILRS